MHTSPCAGDEVRSDPFEPPMWSFDAVLPVAVMIASPAGTRAADPMLWQVTGIVVGEQFAASARSGTRVRAGPEGELFLWRGFSLRLRPSQAEDYALNLGSERPEVFVIARFDPACGVEPLEVTVSLDDAQKLDATELRGADELVLSTPMPPEVGRWLEAFVSVHYRPRARKGKGRGKKRSKAIYDAEVGDWAGDEA
ncbi:MAG TPA: DUF3305 domain-containing protein [Rhodocyclaceae bacterium]|nr:DUF3305 domain-containing protein [Rhodocyclaceae bacterium]